MWRCKHSNRNKTSGKTAISCPAKIDIKIKLTNKNTKRTDPFLRGDHPLPAVIKLYHQKDHTHSTESADALRRLCPTSETKHTFYNYFEDGMTPAEAIRLHESKLIVQEGGYAMLANAAINPAHTTIYYWHRLWREDHFGKDVDPLEKIAEKMPLYEEQGEHIFKPCMNQIDGLDKEKFCPGSTGISCF